MRLKSEFASRIASALLRDGSRWAEFASEIPKYFPVNSETNLKHFRIHFGPPAEATSKQINVPSVSGPLYPRRPQGTWDSSCIFLYFVRPTPKTQTTNERALDLVSEADLECSLHMFRSGSVPGARRGERRAESRPKHPGPDLFVYPPSGLPSQRPSAQHRCTDRRRGRGKGAAGRLAERKVRLVPGASLRRIVELLS